MNDTVCAVSAKKTTETHGSFTMGSMEKRSQKNACIAQSVFYDAEHMYAVSFRGVQIEEEKKLFDMR